MGFFAVFIDFLVDFAVATGSGFDALRFMPVDLQYVKPIDGSATD